jgi:hypothetical protein
MSRIIDQHIDIWQASVEFEEMALRRCVPSEEPYWRRRLEAARAVLEAQRAYLQAIGKPRTVAQRQLAQARRAFVQNPTPALSSSIKALAAAVHRGE